MRLSSFQRERRLDTLFGLPARRRPRLPKEVVIKAYQDMVQQRGRPVGRSIFIRDAGITAYYWQGNYWASWAEFQAECGVTPNRQNTRIADEVLLQKYVEAALALKKLPSECDLRMWRRADPSCPNSSAFFHLGKRHEMLAKVTAYCQGKPRFAPVASLVEQARVRFMSRKRQPGRSRGFVYLARSKEGDWLYTIGQKGKTPPDDRCLAPSPAVLKVGRPAPGRRRLQRLATEMSVLPETIHIIDTDDPDGIADYWRRRFRARRMKLNCYRLYPEDIAAFKRRQYQ
jgi:hypothetical protein